jgi:hypothetical protein
LHFEYKNCDLSGGDVVAWHRDSNVSKESVTCILRDKKMKAVIKNKIELRNVYKILSARPDGTGKAVRYKCI